MEEKKKSPIKIAGEAVLSIALMVLSFFLQYGIQWNYEWLGMLIMFGAAICFFAGYVIGEDLLPKRKTPLC
ncbi:MAG: hypothetical protein J5750_02335 [Clostridiales bacterium]|nr:hypothetical protein [Clostridiales bacterium]